MARPPSPQITPHTRRTRLECQLHGVQGLGRPADDGQGDHVLPRVHLAGPALRNRDALSGPAARPPGELGFSAGRGWLTAAQLRSGQASRVWWRRRLEGSSPTASPGRACRERAAGFAPGVRTAPLENAGGTTAVASGKRPPAAGRPRGSGAPAGRRGTASVGHGASPSRDAVPGGQRRVPARGPRGLLGHSAVPASSRFSWLCTHQTTPRLVATRSVPCCHRPAVSSASHAPGSTRTVPTGRHGTHSRRALRDTHVRGRQARPASELWRQALPRTPAPAPLNPGRPPPTSRAAAVVSRHGGPEHAVLGGAGRTAVPGRNPGPHAEAAEPPNCDHRGRAAVPEF